MAEPVLEVSDATKQYAKVRAVDELSFAVRPGEIFALLGPNGAGKTTMVRMLLGILRPDSGDIRWNLDGVPAADPDPRRLGYLPEERGMQRDVPIQRSLVYFAMLRGMDRRAAAAASAEWLERLDLADRAGDKLDSLSKGNQQKVQFAAAVLHRPDFAVLDEPFSGFDPVNQERFLEHIADMRDAGATILLSAHQMALVERVADRILLIADGRELLAGTLDEIRSEVGAGPVLAVELEEPIDAAAVSECPGVERAESIAPHRLRLHLVRHGVHSDVLGWLAQRHRLHAVQDERTTLHDIYVEAVERGGGTTDEVSS